MTTARRDDLHPDVETMLDALESGFPDVTAHPVSDLREIIGSRRAPLKRMRDSAGGNLAATAELDPSRSAGDDHAERLTAEGDPVVAHRSEGLFHGFLTFPQPSLTGPARDELWKLIRRRLEVTV